MEVARSKKGIFISQRKYTLDLLRETRKLGCRPATTPLDRNWKHKIIEDDPLWKGIIVQKNEHRSVKCFADADWAGSVKDSKSTTRYYTKVWGNLVTWRSKKKSVVTRSSRRSSAVQWK
uniref:Mitochondrial protein n=1 Tax=Cajanus cajan TaxID=3821 RepID=A0A151SBY9_CAJCA|nr:hypothetical protein KK1_025875 [Cajanus cajan]